MYHTALHYFHLTPTRGTAGWWGVHFKSGAANLIKSSGVCAAACAAVA